MSNNISKTQNNDVTKFIVYWTNSFYPIKAETLHTASDKNGRNRYP